MNTIVTSREEILKASRKLAMEKGWKAVSIRSVAAACGVSVGSIYYYFPSKTALLTDTVESNRVILQCLRIQSAVSDGYMRGWRLEAENTRIFLRSIRWASCREKRLGRQKKRLEQAWAGRQRKQLEQAWAWAGRQRKRLVRLTAERQREPRGCIRPGCIFRMGSVRY